MCHKNLDRILRTIRLFTVPLSLHPPRRTHSRRYNPGYIIPLKINFSGLNSSKKKNSIDITMLLVYANNIVSLC